MLDNSDLIVIPFWIELFDIAPVEKDLALLRVIEALDKRYERRLATTTGTA